MSHFIRESDRRDAEMLARIARTDENLLYPVGHVSEEKQCDLLQIKLRDKPRHRTGDNVVLGLRASMIAGLVL